MAFVTEDGQLRSGGRRRDRRRIRCVAAAEHRLETMAARRPRHDHDVAHRYGTISGTASGTPLTNAAIKPPAFDASTGREK